MNRSKNGRHRPVNSDIWYILHDDGGPGSNQHREFPTPEEKRRSGPVDPFLVASDGQVLTRETETDIAGLFFFLDCFLEGIAIHIFINGGVGKVPGKYSPAVWILFTLPDRADLKASAFKSCFQAQL
jgi:hypothetical protein